MIKKDISLFEIVRQINAFGKICSSKDTLESERIQNRPPTKLTIGLGNRLLKGVKISISTDRNVNSEYIPGYSKK